METLQQVPRTLSVPETNMISSLLLDQLDYVVHLPLSSVLLLLLVSLKLWVFEKIHDPLASENTRVKLAFFVVSSRSVANAADS